jgi:hypothetical protein
VRPGKMGLGLGLGLRLRLRRTGHNHRLSLCLLTAVVIAISSATWLYGDPRLLQMCRSSCRGFLGSVLVPLLVAGCVSSYSPNMIQSRPMTTTIIMIIVTTTTATTIAIAIAIAIIFNLNLHLPSTHSLAHLLTTPPITLLKVPSFYRHPHHPIQRGPPVWPRLVCPPSRNSSPSLGPMYGAIYTRCRPVGARAIP